jgi:peroxiredoxin
MTLMNNPKRWLFWAILLICLGVIIAVKTKLLTQVADGEDGRRGAEGLKAGTPAPDFALTALDGRKVTLAEFKGKPVILNFWATWCGPCRREMPGLQAFYDKHRSDGWGFLTVSKESPETLEAFLRERPHSFPVLVDSGGTVGDLYKVRSIPKTFLIDAEGTIRKVISGAISDPEKALGAFIREAKGEVAP